MRALACCGLTVAGCLLATPILAQTRAYAVPRSADIVQLRVVRGNAEAEVRVQNGGLARLAVSGGATLGLTPVIVETGIAVVVAAITRDATTGNERIRHLQRVSLLYQAATRIEAEGEALDVTWTGTLPPPVGPPAQAFGPCVICCVTCDGITWCGCEVITSCGRCCCPLACGCDQGMAAGAAGDLEGLAPRLGGIDQAATLASVVPCSPR
jgi:hypothetical protein